MDLNKLFTEKRSGVIDKKFGIDTRSEYQRDYDRIVFSSAFRRLQNKTQVFPLPGSVFVHNRLTHSLEVASIGRSLGKLAGEFIVDTYGNNLDVKAKNFYNNELYNVIASACLCHDIGNPSFGHSGEDAISNYFIENQKSLKSIYNEAEWQDLINFEGNANAFRILTNSHPTKPSGGLRLTYTTLAAIAKYPCESKAIDMNYVHSKKFGFFQTSISEFKKMVEFTGMEKSSDDPIAFLRHPFVWLTEAADDICYHIIDLEDAHKLRIVSFDECSEMIFGLLKCLLVDPEYTKIRELVEEIDDKNESIAYLRAKSINVLTKECIDIYKDKFDIVLDGTLNQSLFDILMDECGSLKTIVEYSKKHIYNYKSVVEIENAGYNVLGTLLNHFLLPILKEESKRRKVDTKALELVPAQFKYSDGTNYEKTLGIVDFVSGMTDNYANDLYRKIRGIDIGMYI